MGSMTPPAWTQNPAMIPRSLLAKLLPALDTYADAEEPPDELTVRALRRALKAKTEGPASVPLHLLL